MTWTEERRIEFLEECAEWPVTVSRNGLDAIGTKTPDMTRSVMGPAGYMTQIETMFSLLREDFVRLGLEGPQRKRFSCGGVQYEWQRLQDDSSEPTIQFFSYRLV